MGNNVQCRHCRSFNYLANTTTFRDPPPYNVAPGKLHFHPLLITDLNEMLMLVSSLNAAESLGIGLGIAGAILVICCVCWMNFVVPRLAQQVERGRSRSRRPSVSLSAPSPGPQFPRRPQPVVGVRSTEPNVPVVGLREE